MRRWALPLAGLLALGALSSAPAGEPVLRTRADVPLPGPPVRFDYQSVDTLADRLYISHMNAGELLVFDVRNDRVAGIVGDLPRVTGLCAVPPLGKLYASVPGDHHVAIVDTRTLQITARVGKVGFPDGIAYAPEVRKIYVSDESGGGELVIDGRSSRVLTTIPIGGEAGNTVYDPVSRRVLVAVQSQGEIVEIDPDSDRVAARHALPAGSHPHGVAIDPDHRLLFVADDEHAVLITARLPSMKVVGRHELGEGPDVLAFDPGWQRLYVASESGRVSVFTEREGRLVADGAVVLPHAHSVAVDPRTHLVYLPLESVEGRPVLRIMEARRP